MTKTADAEHVITILGRLLADVIDEVVDKKIAAALNAQSGADWRAQTCRSDRSNLKSQGAVAMHGEPSLLKPLLVSVEDAARALAVHEATIYRMRKQGKIETTRIGRRTLVPVREIERLSKACDQISEATPVPPPPRIQKRRLTPRYPAGDAVA